LRGERGPKKRRACAAPIANSLPRAGPPSHSLPALGFKEEEGIRRSAKIRALRKKKGNQPPEFLEGGAELRRSLNPKRRRRYCLRGKGLSHFHSQGGGGKKKGAKRGPLSAATAGKERGGIKPRAATRRRRKGGRIFRTSTYSEKGKKNREASSFPLWRRRGK